MLRTIICLFLFCALWGWPLPVAGEMPCRNTVSSERFTCAGLSEGAMTTVQERPARTVFSPSGFMASPSPAFRTPILFPSAIVDNRAGKRVPGTGAISPDSGPRKVVPAPNEPAWTAGNIATLQEMFPTKQALDAFMRVFYLEAPAYPNTGEYEFVSFDRSTNVYLMITLDWKGDGSFTSLLVVKKEKDKLLAQEVRTGGPSITNLSDIVVDLKNDGRQEVLIPRALGPQDGTMPPAVIPDIYQWDGKQLVQSNGAFKDYYAEVVLPHLREEMAAVSRDKHSASLKLKHKFEAEIDELMKIVNQ
jgi:hypothetical protein